MLKAEICAWGCGPAPFSKVFASKSWHLRLPRRKSREKPSRRQELSWQMLGCSPWALLGLNPRGEWQVGVGWLSLSHL